MSDNLPFTLSKHCNKCPFGQCVYNQLQFRESICSIDGKLNSPNTHGYVCSLIHSDKVLRAELDKDIKKPSWCPLKKLFDSEKSSAKGVMPLPYNLSQYRSQTEVLYKCPTCGCDLRMLGQVQNYCYKCGQKFDWAKLPKYCSEAFRDEFMSFRIKYDRNEITYEEMKSGQELLMLTLYRHSCTKK